MQQHGFWRRLEGTSQGVRKTPFQSTRLPPRTASQARRQSRQQVSSTEAQQAWQPHKKAIPSSSQANSRAILSQADLRDQGVRIVALPHAIRGAPSYMRR